MKTFYLFILIAITIASCQKEIDNEGLKVNSEPVFIQYTILPGEQYSDKNFFTKTDYTEQRFIVRFDSSAIYYTLDTLNQNDVNKLYGFADNDAHHQQFSARFGWRWQNHELQMLAYVYNKAVRTDTLIGAVQIGKEHTCSIKVAGNKYIFTLNGIVLQMPRESTTPTAIGYKLYPYFGGDELAPHLINIWIKEY